MTETPTAPRTPAGKLVTAFGDVERMQALYAPYIEWSLPAGLPLPRPMKGREAVIAFNTSVWSQHYFGDCATTILDETGDDAKSAVRFIYCARFRPSGETYENEYTLFARSGSEGITEVFEALDTVALLDQRRGEKPGATFAQAATAASSD